MSDFDNVVERYLAVWNEPDPETRRAAIDDLCAPGVRYIDPMAAVTGRDALDALIGAVQQQFPGLRFTPAGPPDAHHDQARFAWNLGAPGAEPLVVGFDVAELDANGQIHQVFGFLDRVPAA
jgi:hypothetical protein